MAWEMEKENTVMGSGGSHIKRFDWVSEVCVLLQGEKQNDISDIPGNSGEKEMG